MLLLIVTVAALSLVALGTWQLERRSWKLHLIEQIDQRVNAAPTSLPDPHLWTSVTQEEYAYRHVRATGVFLNDRETFVRASTVKGSGYWVMTPLKTDDGSIVLINRGFVPSELRDPQKRAAGQITGATTVIGLIRMTEPGGGFLRSNKPVADQWYSRDVTAIAAARGLSRTAPYFIDADDRPNEGGFPVGGLTVISLPNNHLLYALTWFTLAFMLISATITIFFKQR